jgi:TolA-binding protein
MMMKKYLAVLLVAVFAVPSLYAAPWVRVGNQKIPGLEIRSNSRDGTITMTLADGAGKQEFAKGNYVEAYADPPAELRKAQSLVLTGKHEEALPMLADIYRKYRFLTVDLYAAELMAKAEIALDKSKDTVARYEEILGDNRRLIANPRVKWPYFSALIANGQFDKVEPSLGKMIQEGTREDAARAQMLRGDIQMVREKPKDAVLDYLRTSMFYQKVPGVAAEALFKAANTLESLRDNRSKKLYQELVDKYPDTLYGRQAQRKL